MHLQLFWNFYISKLQQRQQGIVATMSGILVLQTYAAPFIVLCLAES
jgi:hypothetical protein